MANLTRLVPVLVCSAVISLDGRSDDKSKSTPVLWRDPGAISARDLYWGIGSSDKAPMPPFTFEKEDTGGTNPKLHVTDANGEKWNVKFPGSSPTRNEVHAEVAASRLTWALGYMVEESYYVHEGKIEGIGKLGRSIPAIAPDGTFRAARFEGRRPHVVRTGRSWTFDQNPFVGSKELSGLKILTVLLNNWDIRKSNTNVLRVTTDDGRVEDWHVFSDLGATFGRTDDYIFWVSRHTRWNLSHYQAEAFIDGVRANKVDLHYGGEPVINVVPLEHARWFAGLARQLEADQVRRAFEAAGASAQETDGFTARVMEKIEELWRAVNQS